MKYELNFLTQKPRVFDTFEELHEFVHQQFEDLSEWYFLPEENARLPPHADNLKSKMEAVLNVSHGQSSQFRNQLLQLDSVKWDPVGSKTYDLVKQHVRRHGLTLASLFWQELAKNAEARNRAQATLLVALFDSRIGEEGTIDRQEVNLRLADIDEKEKQLTATVEQIIVDIEKAVEVQEKSFATKLKELRRNYIEFSSFDQPKKYWEVKREFHKKQASTHLGNLKDAVRNIFLAAFFIVVGMGVIFYKIVDYQVTVPSQMYLAIAGVLFFLTSCAFWTIRVYVRLYLSHIHLETDADERVAMAKTYLALHFGKQIQDDDRKIILTSLFRHTADGVVSDDAAPIMAIKDMIAGR